ncbi:hypothetical protein HGRIS_004143 [Hohenbuehelia grisea]|uniref:F-box domain-containing protein n=1 Tax=Hohenbuehelia grisea TaxID=104357 RepID=A0ABR3JHL0_9AGAR
MHPCLRNDELVSMICAYLFNGCLLNLHHVLSLGLTSKTILEPCLDRIWSNIDEFHNMLLLFPTDSYEILLRDDGPFLEHEGDDHPCVIRFTRPLVPEDWTRFHYYSHRVRRLGIWGFGTMMDPDALRPLQESLQAHPSLAPILPKFTRLDYNDGRPGVTPYLPMFSSSSLRILQIDVACPRTLIDGVDDAIRAVAPKLVEAFPNITLLKLEGVEQSSLLRLFHIGDQTITSPVFSKLEKLEVGSPGLFEEPVTTFTAGLQRLKKQRIPIYDYQAPESPLDILPVATLKSAKIEDRSLASSASFLSAIQPERLLTLRLKFSRRQTMWDLASFAQLILAVARFSSLTALTIDALALINDDHEGPSNVYELPLPSVVESMGIISPLLQLKHLEILEVLHVNLCFDDTLLPCMLKAYPCLRTLRIYPTSQAIEYGIYVPPSFP